MEKMEPLKPLQENKPVGTVMAVDKLWLKVQELTSRCNELQAELHSINKRARRDRAIASVR